MPGYYSIVCTLYTEQVGIWMNEYVNFNIEIESNYVRNLILFFDHYMPTNTGHINICVLLILISCNFIRNWLN